MAIVTLPYTLQAGTPENVNNLMANLNALVAGTNVVDSAQIASLAVSSAKLAVGATSATYVTTLPSSPVDGQEVYFAADASNGVIWHLRYRDAATGYKWEYVGGPPICSAVNTNSRTLTNQLTYADYPTDQVTLALPSGIGGDFDITGSVYSLLTGGAGITPAIYWSYSTDSGGTNASDAWAVVNVAGGGVVGGGSMSTTYRHTSLTAGVTIREKGRTVGNYSNIAQIRSLSILPVRVG